MPVNGAPASRATSSATSRSRPKKKLGVLDVERGQALERADHDAVVRGGRLGALPHRLQLDDAARQVVLDRTQRGAFGREPARRVPTRARVRAPRSSSSTGSDSSDVLAQDRLVQPPQLRAGLDAHALDERRPGLPVRLQRVRLAAGAVQREHPLRVQRLPQRLLEHEPLELADHLAVPAGGEVELDRQLDGRQPQLLQPADLGGGERLAGDVVERGAAPQGERLARPAAGHEPLEARDVEVVGDAVRSHARA